MLSDPIDHLAARFTPVPVRARADGWTAERQRGFVRALGAGASVGDAAARVGMSRRSAYRLHDRPHARSLRRAWRIAQEMGRPAPPDRIDWRGTLRVHRWRGRVVHRQWVGGHGRLCRLTRRHFARVEREARAPPPRDRLRAEEWEVALAGLRSVETPAVHGAGSYRAGAGRPTHSGSFETFCTSPRVAAHPPGARAKRPPTTRRRAREPPTGRTAGRDWPRSHGSLGRTAPARPGGSLRRYGVLGRARVAALLDPGRFAGPAAKII